jgi:hypothetical protein
MTKATKTTMPPMMVLIGIVGCLEESLAGDAVGGAIETEEANVMVSGELEVRPAIYVAVTVITRPLLRTVVGASTCSIV